MKQRKKYKKTHCDLCGKELTKTQRQKGGRYCSIICRFNARKKTIIVNCLNCGKEFKTIPSRIKSGGGKFCCNKCRLTYKWDNYEYTYNKHFFDKINPLSAYFMGLFITDGRLTEKNNWGSSSIRIGLTNKQIIYDVADAIEYTGTIGEYEKEYEYKGKKKTCIEYVLFLSGPVVKRIESFGYKPGKKEGKEFIPEQFKSKKIFRYILRSIIDGDGCMSLYKNNTRLQCSITCSNKNFLKTIKKILKEYGIIKGGSIITRKPKKNRKTQYDLKNTLYVLAFGPHDSINIGKYIYTESIVPKINYKYEHFKLVENIPIGYPRIHRSEQEKLKIINDYTKFLKEGISAKDALKQLNVHRSTLYGWKKQRNLI